MSGQHPPVPTPTPLTDRRVLAIALPIVLSNATIPILGAVNTGVIGQLGQAAPIGAVGLGAVILAGIYWIFGFLRMGTSGLVAQARGAGDEAEVAAHLARALTIGLVLGVIIAMIHGPLIAGAFALAPASVEVETLAGQYLAIRFWGAPATISIYAITGWLIALERTRAVLIQQLVMNGLNIILSIWFVLGLGWGVPGVAVATLIAEYAGLVIGLWLARHALRGALANRVRGQAGLFAKDKMRRLVSVNGDILIRSVLLQGSFTTFMFMAAGQGDQTLAANQVLLQFLEITAYGLDGFAFAAEALVGQAVGARRPDRLRAAVRITAKWGVVGAFTISAVFWFTGPVIIDMLTTAPGVRAEAREYLPWLVLGPIIGIASWMLDGIFIGAMRTREMRDAMLVAVAAYASLVIALPPIMGNHGLWAALMGLNILRAISLAVRYRSVRSAAQP